MKDATGELSMTAIAVVAIAAIGVVFSQLVWPAIKANITRSAHCSEAYNCGAPDAKSNLMLCSYLDESNQPQSVSCPSQKETKAAAGS